MARHQEVVIIMFSISRGGIVWYGIAWVWAGVIIIFTLIAPSAWLQSWRSCGVLQGGPYISEDPIIGNENIWKH